MSRPFLGWPGWPHLFVAALLGVLNAGWFVLVYGGCDRITAWRTLRVPVALPIELSIPFVPGAVLGYVSLYGLFLLALSSCGSVVKSSG